MTFREYAKQAEKFTVDHSPAILTGIGVTGTIMTAVLTGRASIKAAEIIKDYEAESYGSGATRPFTPKEKVNLVWKEFIPPVLVGSLTCAAIIGANQIGTRRAAAVAAAYAISDKAFTEYKEKVAQKLTAPKATDIQDSIAEDRVRANPVSSNVVVATNGEVLCYEMMTGRYFKSDMETIKKAQNDLNYKVLNDSYASVSDFYDLLGLPHTKMSDDMGWNCDKLLEIAFSTVMSDDQKPCIAIDYTVAPINGYYRLH